jgi:hypothetical protein
MKNKTIIVSYHAIWLNHIKQNTPTSTMDFEQNRVLLTITQTNKVYSLFILLFEVHRMRKYVLFIVMTLLLITVLPAVADGGHGGEDEAIAAVAPVGNNILLGVSILLTLFMVGGVRVAMPRLSSATVAGVQMGTPKPWTTWRMGILVLGSFAAFVHLGLGFRGDALLVLNGLGYLGIVGLLAIPIPFLQQQRQWVRWLLVAYAAVTFIGYFVMHDFGGYSNMGILTKIAELGLLIFAGMQIWLNSKELR